MFLFQLCFSHAKSVSSHCFALFSCLALLVVQLKNKCELLNGCKIKSLSLARMVQTRLRIRLVSSLINKCVISCKYLRNIILIMLHVHPSSPLPCYTSKYISSDICKKYKLHIPSTNFSLFLSFALSLYDSSWLSA